MACTIWCHRPYTWKVLSVLFAMLVLLVRFSWNVKCHVKYDSQRHVCLLMSSLAIIKFLALSLSLSLLSIVGPQLIYCQLLKKKKTNKLWKRQKRATKVRKKIKKKNDTRMAMVMRMSD